MFQFVQNGNAHFATNDIEFLYEFLVVLYMLPETFVFSHATDALLYKRKEIIIIMNVI